MLVLLKMLCICARTLCKIILQLHKLIKIGISSSADTQSCDKRVIKRTEDVIYKIVTVLVLSQRLLALTVMSPNHLSTYNLI